MGIVFTVYNIYPEGPDDVEKIQNGVKSALPDKAELADMKLEPLAFGISIVQAGIKTPDEPGLSDTVEEALTKIPGVRNVEIGSVTLI